MRIKAIVEPFKYNEHKKFNDTSEYKTKQNDNNVKVSFYEILKQAKESYIYKTMRGQQINIVTLEQTHVLVRITDSFYTILFGSIALSISGVSKPFSSSTCFIVLFSSSAFNPICEAMS